MILIQVMIEELLHRSFKELHQYLKNGELMLVILSKRLMRLIQIKEELYCLINLVVGQLKKDLRMFIINKIDHLSYIIYQIISYDYSCKLLTNAIIKNSMLIST